jgi:hypothetical protein
MELRGGEQLLPVPILPRLGYQLEPTVIGSVHTDICKHLKVAQFTKLN